MRLLCFSDTKLVSVFVSVSVFVPVGVFACVSLPLGSYRFVLVEMLCVADHRLCLCGI